MTSNSNYPDFNAANQTPPNSQAASPSTGQGTPVWQSPVAPQPQAATQQTLPGNPFRNAPTPAPEPGQPYASYGQSQVFAPKKPRGRVGIAGVVAVALLAAGIGGGASIAADHYFGTEETQATTSTTVIQGDATAPDWTATAEAVSDGVVAIQVAGSNGSDSGQGSGVVLDTQGNIVTNNHVISSSGSNAQITVVIGDHSYDATVVGTDPSTDLAVIRLVDPPNDLTTVSFGDSDALEVGEQVMAIGNPLGLSDTVTTGIISALNRPVTTQAVSNTVGDSGNGVVVTSAIQTNAAINPGNSGGALVNAEGELIGITSSIATLTSSTSSSQSGNIGIGFAIPASQVQYVAEQLIANGTAEHPQLGVNAQDGESDGQLGSVIERVVDGSAADQAGLQVGDLVTAVDGIAVTSSESLVALIRNAEVGEEVVLTVLRNGSQEQISATLQSASE